MAIILDGKTLAVQIREQVRVRVASLQNKPGLAVILVGSDPASHTYVALKEKACEEADIKFEKYLYFATEPEETIIQKIKELNSRADIDGILVQLPLPTQDADKIIAAIDPKKDVDGFHPINVEKMRKGEPALISAVALGVMRIIESAIASCPDIRERRTLNAVIIASQLFAEPIEFLLSAQKINVVVADDTDASIVEKTQAADILIVAKGIPGLINGSMVKHGAIVIDVGTTRTTDGFKGDVDFESVEPIACALTPVPGGVGPMTVAMLLENILKTHDLNDVKKI